jgi:osmoprotectant transport system ATP-binding protein
MIELRNLTKRYGSTTAVDDLSLTVAAGEMLVLLGGSGSGKTTTLKMINRLIEPTAGHVRIDGVDAARMPPYLLRRRIGYVFQRIGLFPHMTIAENIAVTPELVRWPRARIASRVDELLALVELDPAAVRDRRPSELSGGEQQRVGVARALAAEPRVMLLDEPFGALDALTRDHLQESFVRIRRALDLTVIFVTHDLVEAMLLGDRIAVLHGGRLAQVGTPRELAAAPADDYVRQIIDLPRQRARRASALMDGERP